MNAEPQPTFIVTLHPGINVRREDAAAVIRAALQFTGIQAEVDHGTIEYGREHFGFEGIIPADGAPFGPHTPNVHKRIVGPWQATRPAQTRQDRPETAVKETTE